MDYAKFSFPLEYWEERKEFLRIARTWFCFGKVRMVKTKTDCSIIFYHNSQVQYIVSASMNFGAWLKYKGYKTLHNDFDFEKQEKIEKLKKHLMSAKKNNWVIDMGSLSDEFSLSLPTVEKYFNKIYKQGIYSKNYKND
jgi:hypothetical protein